RPTRRLRRGGRLGADPRPQPRHELASAGRGGDDRRRPRDSRSALDPRARPEFYLPRLPLPRAAALAQPHHGAQDRAGAARSRGRGSEAEAGGDGVLGTRYSISMATPLSFHWPSDGMNPSWYFTFLGVVSKRPFRRSTPLSSILASSSAMTRLATIASNTACFSTRSLKTARSLSGGN